MARKDIISRNNVLILGNGFDLALGLSTKYVDFVQSKYWPIKDFDPLRYGEDNLYNFLYNHIRNNTDSLGRIRWIDLEDLMRRYVLSKSSGSIRFANDKAVQEYDKDVLGNIKRSFIKYLSDIVDKQVPQDGIPTLVIKHIAESRSFKRVYSFNYTKTGEMLDSIARWKPEVVHIHGYAYGPGNEIILGVGDNSGVSREYKFFLKDRQKGYLSHDLNEDLFEADQIVFYGLSFGASDFVYFKRFFEETMRNHNLGTKKKVVHIFTYDDTSKDDIADAFEDAGLKMSEVYSRIDIRFYVATDHENYINGYNAFEQFEQTMHDTRPKYSKLFLAEIERFMRSQFGIGF